MQYVKTLLLISAFFLFHPSDAQVMKSRIVKVGYAGEFMPFQENSHYSIHFDLENSTRNNFVTNEFGGGFMRNGTDLYYAKFDYKFYPLSAIFRNHRYQGLYASIGPGIYYEDLYKMENRFGLGIFTTAGVQLFLNNRLSIAFEVEMDLVSNLNYQAEMKTSEANHAKFFANSFKIGYLFNRKSRTH